MSEKLIVQTGDEATEWPEPVRRAFVEMCLIADAHHFDVICAVGFDFKSAKGGDVRMGAFFSPRASSNPHRAEMCDDIRRLFEKIVERSTQ